MPNRHLMPYYTTRALVSALLGVWAATALNTWVGGLLFAVLLFAGFVWYAQSGWFQVDPKAAFFPLRRDERGQSIRNHALVVAVAIGGVVFALASVLAPAPVLGVGAGTLALFTTIGCYALMTAWRFLSGS